MKAYLQDARGSQLVYWIKRSDHAVTGWFAAPRAFNEQIGAACESPVDIHFTYPADGDLHFSLKDQTSSDGDEVFETVFSDRVRRKTIVGGVCSVSETPRDAVDSNWHVLMPSSRPRPLNDYSNEPILFQFATAAIPIMNGRVAASALDKLPRSKTVSPQSDPISVRTLGNGVINLCAYLIGVGASFTWPSELKPIWVAQDESRFPRIHLYASFYPK